MTFGSSHHLAPFRDRPPVALGPSRFHPFQAESEPEAHYRRQALQVPRPLSNVALKLQDPRLKSDKNLKWSIDWAVAFVVDHLSEDKSPDTADILKNIRLRAATLEREGQSREIPYRIFNKLDEILFAGHLKNAVFLGMRSLGPDVSGATHTHGWSPNRKIKRASIILNGDVLQHARSKDIVAALIHHMIHAYFLIACGPQQEKELGYGRLDHGPHFGMLMMTIKKLSGKHGKPLGCLDYGHDGGRFNSYYDDEYFHLRRRAPSSGRHRKEKWYASHCHCETNGPNEPDVNKWFSGVCAPLYSLPDTLRAPTVQIYNSRHHELETVPRGETVPSADSCEFLYEDQPVLVPKSHIEQFLSIHRAFESGGSRYLKIKDEQVAHDTFVRFIELLHTGTYGPDPHPAIALGTGRPGPPMIKPCGSANPATPHLLTDIRIFNMGCVMGFDELRGAALERMYRHSVTTEDPVGLLEEIYTTGAGTEPHPDLKVWVRRFLIAPVSEAEFADAGGAAAKNAAAAAAALGGTATADLLPNLAKLENGALPWAPRFWQLLERAGALENEVAKARELLARRGLYPAAAAASSSAAVSDTRLALAGPVSMGGGLPTMGHLGHLGLGMGMGVGMGMRSLPPPMPPGLGLAAGISSIPSAHAPPPPPPPPPPSQMMGLPWMDVAGGGGGGVGMGVMPDQAYYGRAGLAGIGGMGLGMGMGMGDEGMYDDGRGGRWGYV